jgi:hypothetical protein
MITPMNKRRGRVGVGVMNNCLYAFGGHDAPGTIPASTPYDCIETLVEDVCYQLEGEGYIDIYCFLRKLMQNLDIWVPIYIYGYLVLTKTVAHCSPQV